MLNHHNGLVNTINDPSIYDKDGFDVYALNALDTGDELFLTYHDCPDCRPCPTCGSSLDYWGTPEMIRDFGFVEPYPQRFYYKDIGPVYFKIDKNPDSSFSISTKGGELPKMEWIESQIARLQDLYQQDIAPLSDMLPSHELTTIVNYHASLLHLFITVKSQNHVEGMHEEHDSEDEDDESVDGEASSDDEDIIASEIAVEEYTDCDATVATTEDPTRVETST